MHPYSIVFALALLSQSSMALICGCAEGDMICTDACVSDIQACVVNCGVTSNTCYKGCLTRVVSPKIADGITSITSVAQQIASVSEMLADPTAAARAIASDVLDDMPQSPQITNWIHNVPLPTAGPFPFPADTNNDDDDDDDEPTPMPFLVPGDHKPVPSVLPYPLPGNIKPSPAALPYPFPPKPLTDSNSDEDCDDEDELLPVKELPIDLPDIDDLPLDIGSNIPHKDLPFDIPDGITLDRNVIEQYLPKPESSSVADIQEARNRIKDLLQGLVDERHATTNLVTPDDLPENFPLDRNLIDQYLPKPTTSSTGEGIDIKDKLQELMDGKDSISDTDGLDLPAGIPLDALPSNLPVDHPAENEGGDEDEDEDCDDDDNGDNNGATVPSGVIADPVPTGALPTDGMPLPSGTAVPSDVASAVAAGAIPSDLVAPNGNAVSPDAANLVAPASSQQPATVTAHTTITSHLAATPSLGMLHASGSSVSQHDDNHSNGAVSNTPVLTIISTLAMTGITLMFFQL